MSEKKPYKVAKDGKESYVRGPTAGFDKSFDRFGHYSIFKEPREAEIAADLCNLAYEQGVEDARRIMRGALGL